MISTLQPRSQQADIEQGSKQTILRQQGLENTKKSKPGDLVTDLNRAVEEAQKRRGSPVKRGIEKKVFQPHIAVVSKVNAPTERALPPKWKWDRGTAALPNTRFA